MIDVLRQCTHLRKVSLTGASLRAVDLENLLPYGHLFHELHFYIKVQTTAYVQVISNLLITCSNLRRISYLGSGIEEDALFVAGICQACPFLEKLYLESFSFSKQEQIAISTLPRISHACKYLHSLSLVRTDLSRSILQSIVGMKALKTLVVVSCEGLTRTDMDVLTPMRLECIATSIY